MKYKNWNWTIWEAEIKKLKPGLSVKEAANLLGRSWPITCQWLNHFGYKFRETRGEERAKWWKKRARLKPHKVDWSTRDADIARKFGVSRQRVRQVRAKLSQTQKP